jgi:hypothetical protein
MTRNIETFTLTIPKAPDHDDLSPFFQYLVTRMPRISHLILKSHVPMSMVENHIVELLSGMSELRLVTFLNCHLPSRIVEQLSRMDRLYNIKIEPYDVDERAFEGETGTEVFAPCLAEGAFPSLRYLSLRAHLGAAAQFMKSNFAPNAIKRIYITSRSPTPETSFVVEAFLSALACTCPNLEDVFLQCLISVNELPDDPSSELVVTYDALRPIFRPVLRCFEISHPNPLHVTLDDINDIARNCPLLDTFILNCDPAVLDSDQQLPLTALAPFARHCPKIETIGLFFGASKSNFLMAQEDILPPFQKPIILTVGTSDIDVDVGTVTHLLSRMCPLGCNVQIVIEWPGKFGVKRRSRSGVQQLLELRNTRWSQVSCMLPILKKLQTRESVRNLEAKVKVTGEKLDKAVQT